MPLTRIFHLSDLHIRNGDNLYSRYEEYRSVFKETIASITRRIAVLELSFEDFVIVITGDIFHNKNVIGNYGLFVYREFIQSLSNIGRLYIISGNHDYDQSDADKPSLVYSSTFDIPNVVVLNTSTSFVIDDVGFSFVSIDTTLDKYRNSGRIQDLPAFPRIRGDVKHTVALFHGSFASAKLYNGKAIEETFNPYPLEWVQEFDYVLLGDIHKRQVFTYKKKTMCGYSGSLIQQNFGEDIIEHGYLLWNIETKEAEEINVYNNVGYINIIEDVSKNIFIRTNGKYTEPLLSYVQTNIDYFPKTLEIKSFSNINYQTLSTIFNSFGISFQIVSKLNNVMNMNQCVAYAEDAEDAEDDEATDATTKDTQDAHDTNATLGAIDTNYMLVYFKKLLTDDKYKILLKIMKDKEHLLFDINAYPDDLHPECIKRNKDLEPIINLCNQADDVQSLRKSFVIQYLEWDGLLCYENKCLINFKDLDAKTFMIKGANGTGKSAIYDILQLALWATNSKFDTYSAGFINHNKEKGYTIIDIKIDDATYRIKRDFCKKKGTFKIANKSSVLYKFNNDTGDLVILKKDSACNTEVKALFGDIQTFLSTSMITQNVDNDILALNYKDTLETIDKSHNIQFLYHLYNLFKTAINKYRDFRKVIQSKKEVYEKLLFHGTNDSSSGCDVNDEIISQLNEELSSLNTELRDLRIAFNAIPIDIQNSRNLSIIDVDYTSLIHEIETTYPIVSPEVYEKHKETLQHYKYLHSIRDNDDVRGAKANASLYSKQLEDDFNILPCVNKPCDISYITSEKRGLCEYMDANADEGDECVDEADAANAFNAHTALTDAKNDLTELISNKPNKISGYGTDKGRKIERIIKNILKVYGSTDAFNDFIASHTKPRKRRDNIVSQSGSIDEPMTLDNYTNAIQRKDMLTDAIAGIHNQLATYENDFNLLYSKQQQIEIVNIPRNRYAIATVATAKSVVKELRNYNIDAIHLQITEDDAIMKEHLQQAEEIDKIATKIDNYTKELQLFDTNEKYRYNPECHVCCNRPWVSRIKEIQSILQTLQANMDAKRQGMNCTESEIAIVRERFEENNTKQENYNLLHEWYYYYKFKEASNKITNEMNGIISSKASLHEELATKDAELNATTTYIDNFISYSFLLYEEYLCDIYKVWEKKYDATRMRVEDLEKTIHYNEVIRPRIAKYRELQKAYDEWVVYESTKKIIDTYHYYRLKEVIEKNDVYHEYQSNERMKPLILRKLELNALLGNKEIAMKTLNDKIIKYSTINAYNKENKKNYNSLMAIEGNIEAIIDVLDTILTNFQAFRKELYDTMILSRLVDKTNLIIKTLCHQNTKPFKLNYNVDISNDTVHINWLIHNDNISKEGVKQYISVSQASGFQRFAISLALRMSLYFNDYDVLCRQLFIDEGFINFDKNNLSVVPVFLKSLLHYFNTIVILSHIDIIQDSVDETSEIVFNKTNGVSSIVYR
jgi:DNA repair exonuclease SbcCD nuclease subunit/DNA repair exonuclease SbcCD ATPase subunit